MAAYFGVLVVLGCAPTRNPYGPIGYGSWGQPGYSPYGTPIGYLPINNPGGNPPVVWSPGTPVVVNPGPIPNPFPFPNQPQQPETPVVLKPVPSPTDPGNPTSPGTPTTPISNPTTPPITPPVDKHARWAPWPLPPHPAAVAIGPDQKAQFASAQSKELPHAAAVHPESVAEGLLAGSDATSGQDLVYRGGKILQNLSYVNLYVGGEAAGWNLDDVEKIEWATEQSLQDPHLNNVLRQYFQNQPIGTTTLAPHPLVGFKPSVVSRGDIQHYMEYLADEGYLQGYDLSSTIFNFLLPPGTILTDEDQPKNQARYNDYQGPESPTVPVAGSDETADSTRGLGGYHGSIHYKNQTVYFSVGAYSERRNDGAINGIPVFAEPWKNVCAAIYHQVCEFRTDPDVEDALRDPEKPASVQFLGWTSDSGEEVGDYPLQSSTAIAEVIKEVPLANGQGMVPVQLNYSNAIHAPEGPIEQPH